ncbi:hypothetical protein [Haloferula sp.]|uniref:hypothetical protein n=1 Tax=Haloferula sp. TaxID=2497595 RepID=UPI00329FB1BF
MKRRVFFASLAAVLVPALPAMAAKKKKKSKADKEREERKKKRDAEKKAVDKILRERDDNDDGSLSRTEYVENADDKETASRLFELHNKNRDRNLTRSEIAASLGFD